MKKSILILFAFVLSNAVTAQNTLVSFCYDSRGLDVTYNDNLGKGHSKLYLTANKADTTYTDSVNYTLDYSRYLLSDTALLNALKAAINDRLDSIPMVMASVTDVSYKDETFAISGSYYPLVLKKYSELSAPRQAIIDSWKDKIYEITGINMTTFYTRFGTNKFTMNGVEYSYLDFQSLAFKNAIDLANLLYNNK